MRRVLVAQDKYEAALEIAEAQRARAFVQLLAQSRSDNTAFSKALQQQDITLVEYAFITDENFVAQGKLHGEYKQIYIWVVKPTGEVIFRLISFPALQDSNDRYLIEPHPIFTSDRAS